ncbi:MAG TPA: AI-2E family transporter, partial [Acidimicrobiia bacterium]|nr:AI-2E family transporter [Acidimicrobiia bacterium]
MTQDSRPAAPDPVAEPSRWEGWPPPGYWARIFAILLAMIGAVAILWTLRSVVLVLIASLVLATGLQPSIKWFEARGLKRGWGLAVVLLAGLLVMGGLAIILVPFIAGQVVDLIDNLPQFVAQLEEGPGFVNRIVEFLDLDALLSGGPAGEEPAIDPVAVAAGVGGTVFNIVTVLVVTPYFAIEFPALKAWAVRLLRPKHREDFLYVLNSSIDLIANYMVGNLVISVIAGVVSFIGFTLLDVDYALALAAWVAFTDIIPGVGALLGAAGVAAVVAFQGGPQLVAVLILLAVYQQVENYLIAPRVMNRAIDLNPATVIVALLVGGSLAGLVGALLALPIAATIKIILFELVVPGRIESLRAEVAET